MQFWSLSAYVEYILDSFVVQSLSCSQLFVTPWTAAYQASLSTTVSWRLYKFLSIELVMLSNHLIFCHPLLLLPSIFPNIRVFSNELALLKWPKYWSFIFSINPLSRYSGLSSFRVDQFDLLASKGLSRIFFSTTVWKHQFLGAQPFFFSFLSFFFFFFDPILTFVHDYWKKSVL